MDITIQMMEEILGTNRDCGCLKCALRRESSHQPNEEAIHALADIAAIYLHLTENCSAIIHTPEDKMTLLAEEAKKRGYFAVENICKEYVAFSKRMKELHAAFVKETDSKKPSVQISKN